MRTMGLAPMTNKTLDARIAKALSEESEDRELLFNLWREAWECLKAAEATVQTESARALDIENADPDAADANARKAQRTIDRLTRAIPRLKERVEAIDRRDYARQWHAYADELEGARDNLALELRELYPNLVTQIAHLFARIDQNTAAISDLHGKAPEGEARRLDEAELVSRGLERYTAEQPRLRDSLLLPDFNRPRDVVYPPRQDFSVMAALSAQALTQALAQKYAVTCNADWWQAKQLEDEQQRAEFAQREEAIAAEKAAQKRAYEQSLLDQDRRRQGFRNGGTGGG